MSVTVIAKQAGFRAQLGVALLEVLVSLLILAFGLLGMAGLQTVSLRNNQTAYYRTQATMFATDIVERMRGNILAVDNSNYDDIAGADTASCFTAVGCTSTQMAAQDVNDWSADIVASLPSGNAVVCLDSTANDGTSAANACDGLGDVYATKIWWDDNRDGNADQRFVMSFQPL